MQNVLSVWWQRFVKEARRKRTLGWAQRGLAMVWVCNVLQRPWLVTVLGGGAAIEGQGLVEGSKVTGSVPLKGVLGLTFSSPKLLIGYHEASSFCSIMPSPPRVLLATSPENKGTQLDQTLKSWAKKNLPFQFLPWVFCHNHQKLAQNPKNLWRHCEQKQNSIGIAITTYPPDKINTCEWTITRMNKWIHGLIQGVGGTCILYSLQNSKK